MPDAETIAQTLHQAFGHDHFLPGQRPAVDALLEGRHVVAVMPTGSGKSLCYQLPALLLDGVTLVVSPLISLMKDQVDSLTARGLPAAFINSTLDYDEQRSVLAAAGRGDLKLLYVAPERFRFAGAMAAIRSIPLAAFVVDEAHCVSQWGHDFRPDYLALGSVAAELGASRLAAFTATATPRVRGDIVELLGMQSPFVQVTGFMRDNLHLAVHHVRRMTQKRSHLERILSSCGGSGIVYCATRGNCEKVAAWLLGRGIDAAVYHGGLEDRQRAVVHEAFMAGERPVIVATNAFGMGVDKPDIRAVIHYDLPGSPEAYYQEAGRAGRDGEPATCTLLFTYADTRYHEYFISNGGQDLPPERRTAWEAHERSRLREMVRYAYAEGCRHGVILRYFGERLAIGEQGCGACDVCEGDAVIPRRSDEAAQPARVASVGRAMSDEEEVFAQKVLSAVARSAGRLSSHAVARLLTGSKAADILTDPLVESKSYNLLAGWKVAEVSRFLKALARAGCTRGTRPQLTERGFEVMWRRQTVQLDIAPLEEPKPKRARSRQPAEEPELSAADAELFERLREARIEAARARGVSAFVIATNRVLTAIALARPDPASDDEWLAIPGIGPNNVSRLRRLFGPILADS